MGFRYRFETVLRQKQRVVDEVAARLAHAMRLVRQEQDTLALLENTRVGHQQYYAAALRDGDLDARLLQTAAQYADFLEQALAEQHERIREMARRAEEIRALLVDAERDRQVFANLKERQRTRFYAELATRERAYFDGIANTLFTAKHQTAARERTA